MFTLTKIIYHRRIKHLKCSNTPLADYPKHAILIFKHIQLRPAVFNFKSKVAFSPIYNVKTIFFLQRRLHLPFAVLENCESSLNFWKIALVSGLHTKDTFLHDVFSTVLQSNTKTFYIFLDFPSKSHPQYLIVTHFRGT